MSDLETRIFDRIRQMPAYRAHRSAPDQPLEKMLTVSLLRRIAIVAAAEARLALGAEAEGARPVKCEVDFGRETKA
jgi:hypothetical protein